MDVLILGSGVSGLSCGIRLQESGHRVRIWAKALPPDTTSNVAAAVWYPYKVDPVAKVTVWGAAAYQEFQRLAGVVESGVLMADVFELLPAPARDPEWAPSVAGFRHASPDELPSGYADGYAFSAPVIDMAVYLGYLMRRFTTAEGIIEQRTVRSLADAFAACPIVVNCTGLGARELLGDREVRSSRGQVVRVRQNGFRRVLLAGATYIVPRLHDIVLGGTDLEDVERTEVDPATTADILRRCARLAPEFAGITEDDIVSVAVGLRPLRSTVRLEAERVSPDHTVIHNYGHGGAGVTLSWGCADEVAALVEKHEP